MRAIDWAYIFVGWVFGISTPFFMIGYCLLHAHYKDWVKARQKRKWINLKIQF